MSLKEGRKARDEGMDAALEAEDEAYKDMFTKTWIDYERTKRPFFTDNVKDIVGYPPRRANSVGGLVASRVRAGNVLIFDYVQMTSPQSHARRTPRYIGR